MLSHAIFVQFSQTLISCQLWSTIKNVESMLSFLMQPFGNSLHWVQS